LPGVEISEDTSTNDTTRDTSIADRSIAVIT
jgi:hypothetical protein